SKSMVLGAASGPETSAAWAVESEPIASVPLLISIAWRSESVPEPSAPSASPVVLTVIVDRSCRPSKISATGPAHRPRRPRTPDLISFARISRCVKINMTSPFECGGTANFSVAGPVADPVTVFNWRSLGEMGDLRRRQKNISRGNSCEQEIPRSFRFIDDIPPARASSAAAPSLSSGRSHKTAVLDLMGLGVLRPIRKKGGAVREFLRVNLAGWACLAVLGAHGASAAEPTRPNIVFIFSDDHAYQ